MAEATVTVRHASGLHARPAALFYRTTRQFQSRVTVQNLSGADQSEVPVSAINLLQIGVKQGHEICIRAEGPDAEAAIMALTRLVESDFEETRS